MRKRLSIREPLFVVYQRTFESSTPPPPTAALNIACAQRARKEAAEQRAEDERRQFQKLIATYRDSGSTFRETKASVRKAEETRLRIEQDLEVPRRDCSWSSLLALVNSTRPE